MSTFPETLTVIITCSAAIHLQYLQMYPLT